MLVDGEFQDAQTGSGLILLNLFIGQYQDYRHTDNYLVWCKEKSLSAERSEVRAHYFGLKENKTILESILSNIEPISFMEWKLDSGEAQQFRDRD